MMATLSAREGYRLWAGRYEAETAISHLENLTMAELGVSTSGLSLLDVGCGTGRRLRASDAATAVGIDVTVEMLAQSHDSVRAAGDCLALPIASAAFDVVWCRLAIGHIHDLQGAYTELARVCKRGGTLVVTDVAPEAVETGHRRTFVDAEGASCELEHVVHLRAAHESAAQSSKLSLECARQGCVGPALREFYSTAKRLDAYERQLGQPLVHAFSWRKLADADFPDAERGR